MTKKKFLTTGAVAKAFGVSKVTIIRWMEKGNLKSFRLPSGAYRISRYDLDTFARKHNLPTTGY